MGNVINRSAKNPNLRSRNAFGRAVNRPSSLCPCLLYQTFPGTKILPDFCLTWYKLLVQTLFYLPDFMVQIFLVQFFWYNFFFWYKNVRVRVRPQEPDLRSVNAFGHFQFAFPDKYGGKATRISGRKNSRDFKPCGLVCNF